MTNKELKKWLKRCGLTNNINSLCDGCPFEEHNLCFDEMKLAALELIKKQEKEIKQLKTECTLLDDELRNARQETINVLNKLKSKCHNYYPSIDHYCCSVKAVNLSDIDELIKELITNAED